MRLLKLLVLTLMTLGTTITAQARVWHVGTDPGDDFAQIQPAIDASSPGDVILVRVGTYQTFALDKGVTVRSVTGSFTVNQTVAVGRIPAGDRAMLSGINLGAILQVVDSPGSIVLERIVLRPPGAACLVIRDCDDVSIANLDADGEEPLWDDDTETAATVTRSKVRMTDSTIRGNSARFPTYLGTDGATGLEIDQSTVILAHGSVFGGNGSDGDPWASSDGGDGGDAIVASNSDVYAIGGPANLIRGGKGGTVYYDGWWGWLGLPGWGGDGLVVQGGRGLVSRVRLVGGAGGHGEQDAPDGQPYLGDVQRDDTLPWLDMSVPVEQGQPVEVDIDSSGRPGEGVLLLSEKSGFLLDGSLDGIPYFTSVPGGWYLALSVGHTNTSDKIHLSGSLPQDPAFTGMRLDIQGLILGDDGSQAVTNGVSRVVGE